MSNKQFVLALVTAFPPTLVALLAFIKGLRNGRAVKSLHKEVNGRLTQLVDVTEAKAKAEGMVQVLKAVSGKEAPDGTD